MGDFGRRNSSIPPPLIIASGLYHVLAAKVLSTDLKDGQTAKTVEGKSVTVHVSASGAVTINDATVEQADVLACNGVVHVIDAVLLPPAPPTWVGFWTWARFRISPQRFYYVNQVQKCPAANFKWLQLFFYIKMFLAGTGGKNSICMFEYVVKT